MDDVNKISYISGIFPLGCLSGVNNLFRENHENSKYQNTNLKQISMTEIQNSKQIE